MGKENLIVMLNILRLQILLLTYISVIATVSPTTPAKPPISDRAQIGGLLFSGKKRLNLVPVIPLIHTSWHLIIEGGEVSRYSLDFTSISLENLTFIFIIQHKHVLYNLEKVRDLI